MKISVTEADIRLGFNQCYWRIVQLKKDRKTEEKLLEMRCEKCPVALALRRVTGKSAVAHSYRLIVGGKEYRTPEIVSDWMYEFDKAFEMKPFEFELETTGD